MISPQAFRISVGLFQVKLSNSTLKNSTYYNRNGGGGDIYKNRPKSSRFSLNLKLFLIQLANYKSTIKISNKPCYLTGVVGNLGSRALSHIDAVLVQAGFLNLNSLMERVELGAVKEEISN